MNSEYRDIEAGRMAVCARAQSACEVCGKQTLYQDGQAAHIVPQRGRLKEAHGIKAIHDRNNLVWTCGELCNSAVSADEAGPFALGLMYAIKNGDEARAAELRREAVIWAQKKMRVRGVLPSVSPKVPRARLSEEQRRANLCQSRRNWRERNRTRINAKQREVRARKRAGAKNDDRATD